MNSRRRLKGRDHCLSIPNIPCVKFQNLTSQVTSTIILSMQNIKISSKVDEKVWNELKLIAQESHQNVSGLLTEAIRDYVQRRRVRPEVLTHLEVSMDENEELGRLLAK